MNLAVFTNGQKLKAHADYAAAKAGDEDAAFRLVSDIINRKKLMEVVSAIPPGTHITPVAAQEATGRNKIPVAVAALISAAGGEKGFVLELGIVQTNVVRHTGGTALDRLLARPEFAGEITPGKSYFVVDDVVTSGSSVNELRKLIESGKGAVVTGGAVLAAAFNPQMGHGAQLDPLPETIKEIRLKFDPRELNQLLNENGIARSFTELTNAQAKYLTTFASVATLRTQIAARRNQVIGQQPERQIPGPPAKGKGRRIS